MAEDDRRVCSSTEEQLKVRLLKDFRPLLRFDSSEKYFPLSVETFISSSLLLRKEIPAEEALPHQRKHASGAEEAEGNSGTTIPVLDTHRSEHSEEVDEVSNSYRDGDDPPMADASGNAKGTPQEGGKPGLGREQACRECGKRQGWRIPSGWTVAPTPAGTQGWTTETLLEEQERTGDMIRFRLEPHCCVWNGRGDDLDSVPCYAFAQRLDESMIAPFLRRAGIGPVFELKYAFVYGYNGTTFAVPGTSVGAHTGDLEHVTVRVDTRAMSILEVFFAAHSTGEGKWIPSKAFYQQVQTQEAKAHPGVPEEVPEAQREFLEIEVADHVPPPAPRDRTVHSASCTSTTTPTSPAGVGVPVVIYPARGGHASYHMPKRWRRFVGLGDDVCDGRGKVWRPYPVLLDHPGGRQPSWLQFRSRYGSSGCITSEAFWRFQGEPLRRCSAEPKYRSLLEEGLVPDRGVRLGAIRRTLHSNGDQGVWIQRHRQQQLRLPMFDTWTSVPGLGAGKPRNRDPPRIAGRVWLHDWDFVNDRLGGSTDAGGWSYHHLGERDADTGRSGKPNNGGLLTQRGRARVWFRVAGTPAVAREIEVAHQQSNGEHPKVILALAALDTAGHGKQVSSKSILETLSEGDSDGASGEDKAGDAHALSTAEAKSRGRAVVKLKGGASKPFVHMARWSLGLASKRVGK